MTNMEAEIITIGTELLLGEIVDTNTRTIARALRDIGLDLYRTATVGDNVERIAQAVQESIERAQAVITTGGLGPTVDDPTRQAIAQAVHTTLEFRPELWEQIRAHYTRYDREPSENSRQMAFIPHGAIPIANPVGTAPAFIVETEHSAIISLPGVPAELRVLLEQEVIPYLQRRLQLKDVIKTRILRTAGVGESWVDEQIADLERLSNPTVGLAAHPGRVDIRITAKGEDADKVQERIAEMEDVIRQRVGEYIFGTDEETLEGAVSELLQSSDSKLVTIESGTEGLITRLLTESCASFESGEILPDIPNIEDLEQILESTIQNHGVDVGIGIRVQPEEDLTKVDLVVRRGDDMICFTRTYGGPPEYAPYWAASHALEILRKQLIS
jgi:nicotinamide-nucleotide amidase